jgi:hypothetical protein
VQKSFIQIEKSFIQKVSNLLSTFLPVVTDFFEREKNAKAVFVFFACAFSKKPAFFRAVFRGFSRVFFALFRGHRAALHDARCTPHPTFKLTP